MRFLGLRISIAQPKASAALAVQTEERSMTLAGVADGRGWWPLIRESFGGAWQKNVTVDARAMFAFHAIFACITLIASDIAKLRVKLVELAGGIWTETTNPAFSPVLRKPNPWQTRIQFWECWLISKLSRGNTYVLKRRDGRGVVVALYILDPNRVKPLVADDGSVFYELQRDNLSGLHEAIIVPAREIIHDRMNCLFHPLVGVSPIFANALAAQQGLEIQHNSARLFRNNSTPGGILTAPGRINDETAKRLKEHWEENFAGENVGRVAVLGDDLKFEKMALTAVEGQLIEQLKLTAEIVCSTFHVPGYKVGVGSIPAGITNIQSLNVEYYSQCLQKLIEDAEECLDDGLGIGYGVGPGAILGTEFDVDNLLRMDSITQMEVLDKGKNVLTPDEARARLNLPPTPGGNVVYRQQQDFSLEALAKRDAQADPFVSVRETFTGTAPPAPPPEGGKSAQLLSLPSEAKVPLTPKEIFLVADGATSKCLDAATRLLAA